MTQHHPPPGGKRADPTPAAFQALLARDPANELCFDCRRANPDWTSCAFGIFICENCAGKHRELGTHVTRVRSVRLDEWEPAQLTVFQKGGNTALDRFFREFEVAHMDISEKYQTKAADYWRVQLKAQVNLTDCPDPRPTKSEGREMADHYSSAKDRQAQLASRIQGLGNSNFEQAKKPPKPSGCCVAM
uniref:Arf-GAP domain-containing protein n=1 Tax=Oxyrrhis marina TaxID=2969 RepID=A0A7S3UIJ3_OXYMA|mmetsp:Transcript_7853/g.18501  ORF Transcript_7853/g.18501 Transcript_7853/m.18501 type:complete len:189 (-) Transcript_7853:187-753(-)